MAATQRVAGVDRWRGGWAVAALDGERIELCAFAHIDEASERLDACSAIAIDMPLALPVEGRRQAELELRSYLGVAGRSVFYSPTRAALNAPDQASATAINRENGGPGISAQAWGLVASIREVRHALSQSNHRSLWWETHPETAFALMNGGQPLAPKRSARGVAERLRLLRSRYPTIDSALLAAPDRVPIDDVLDAVSAAWSARRIADGTDERFGPAGRDDQDFPLGVRV